MRWKGETVVCCASGPSLTLQDVESIRGKAKVIVTNATFRLAPWADVCYGADHSFWKTYLAEIDRVFTGERWTMSIQGRKEMGLQYVRRGGVHGFNPQPGVVNTGGNSGYQVIHLAASWGAKRIILLGYDMQKTGGKDHWHGKHEGKLKNGGRYGEWCRNFQGLAKDLKAMGVQVVNCSRTTAITAFPRAALESIQW